MTTASTRRIFPLKSGPGRCIVVAAFKGGCGKTTTALALAHHLSKDGRRVCLIDMDPFANLTLALGLHPDNHEENVARVLWSREPAKAIADNLLQFKIPGVGKPVAIVPGSRDTLPAMAGLEHRSAFSHDGDDVVSLLVGVIEALRPYYSDIIIDMPSSLPGLATNMALHAGDVVVSPVMDGGSALALPKLMGRFSRVSRERQLTGRSPLQCFITVPNLLPLTGSSSNTAREPHPTLGYLPPWYKVVQEHFPKHFIEKPVMYSSRLQEAYGKLGGFRAIGSKAKREWRAQCYELMARVSSPHYPQITDMLNAADGRMDPKDAAKFKLAPHEYNLDAYSEALRVSYHADCSVEVHRIKFCGAPSVGPKS